MNEEIQAFLTMLSDLVGVEAINALLPMDTSMHMCTICQWSFDMCFQACWCLKHCF